MYTLPVLSYEFDALEPHIDSRTMQIHHDKHHQSYIDKLNAALKDHPELIGQTVEELVSQVHTLPESVQKAVQNHGGGHANHSLFWEILSPDGGGQPEGEFLRAINDKFGEFDSFQKEFNSTAGSQFGSGWGWLVVNAAGELEVLSTANQDSPLMQGKIPVLGVDVWEHAYYLHYQNRRPDYLEAIWNVIDWEMVSEKYLAAV